MALPLTYKCNSVDAFAQGCKLSRPTSRAGCASICTVRIKVLGCLVYRKHSSFAEIHVCKYVALLLYM